jgi:hypothetical protein
MQIKVQMNIFQLTENIQRKVNEDTTSGSISYLPSGFVDVRQAIRSLTKFKPRWKIEVLEDSGNYNVNFEKQLNIVVPKSHYTHFNQKVLKVEGLNEVDLSSILNEDKVANLNRTYKELNVVLSNQLRSNPKIYSVGRSINKWNHIFRKSKYLPMETPTAIQYDFDTSIQKLGKQIREIYQDDLGKLEALIEAIRETQPLNAFEPFNSLSYIYGVKIESVEEKTVLVLTSTVNTAFEPSQELIVKDKEVLEKLKGYKNIKILNETVFPMNQLFDIQFFRDLSDLLEGKLDA